MPTTRYSKELEREHTRRKQLVADQAFDNSMLTEEASGNFGARRDADRRWPWSATGWACRRGGHAEGWARRGRPTGIGRGCRMMSHGGWPGASRGRRRMGGMGHRDR